MLATRHDLTHAYCLEVNFNSGRRGDPRARFGPAVWAEVGRGSLLALLELAPDAADSHICPSAALGVAGTGGAELSRRASIEAAAKAERARRMPSAASGKGGNAAAGRVGGGVQQVMKEARARMRRERAAAKAETLAGMVAVDHKSELPSGVLVESSCADGTRQQPQQTGQLPSCAARTQLGELGRQSIESESLN